MAKLLTVLAMASAVMAGPLDPFVVNEYTRTALGDAIDKSTMKLLKESYAVAEDKNVVSSPLGVMLLLSLYNTGAGAGSKEEINRFLGETDSKQLSDSYKNLSEELSRKDPSYLTLANKVYVSDQYTPTDGFAAAANSYRSGVETLDFRKPADAAQVINKWASEKTEGNIDSPVSADMLDPDTVAALFNVIYFKGHWDVPFNVSDTKDKDFHVDRKTTVKKPTMRLLQPLHYKKNDELGASMIELPYKEDGFRMIVVLPHEVDGLPSVLEKATETGMLSDVSTLYPTYDDVELDLPKFEIRTKLDFNNILPKIGVSKIFTEPASGIVKERPVVISKVFQEAFIKVDEEGATAGAFTGALMVPLSDTLEPPLPLKFTVDHPFLYLIMYQDKILFAGTSTH